MIDLEAIRERLEKATPGPWGVYIETVPTPDDAKRELARLVDGTTEFSGALNMVVADDCATAVTGCGPDGEANARFMGHSWADIKALVEEVEDLRKEMASNMLNYEMTANATYYEGNSVSWWCSKAKNYGDSLTEAWEALSAAGIASDGKKDTAAGIRELAEEVERLRKIEANMPDYVLAMEEATMLRQRVMGGPRCASCQGQGSHPLGSSWVPCDACNGKGY